MATRKDGRPQRANAQKPPRHYAPKPLMEQRPKKCVSVEVRLPEDRSPTAVEPHILSQLPLAEGFEINNTDTREGALHYWPSYQPSDELDKYIDASLLYRRDSAS